MMSHRTGLHLDPQTPKADRPVTTIMSPASGVLDVQRRRRFAQRLAMLIERIRVAENPDRRDER